MAAASTIAPDGVDAVFDRVGAETFRSSFDTARDGGCVVTIFAFGEGVPNDGGIIHHAFSARAKRRTPEKLSGMLDAGKVRVEIGDVLPSKRPPRPTSGRRRGTPGARSC